MHSNGSNPLMNKIFITIFLLILLLPCTKMMMSPLADRSIVEKRKLADMPVFRLDKEKSEAERKRIAAEGEAAANKIINNSLTPELLRMRGIEATTQLAESENAKVIVIGGKDGLPLILGNN